MADPVRTDDRAGAGEGGRNRFEFTWRKSLPVIDGIQNGRATVRVVELNVQEVFDYTTPEERDMLRTAIVDRENQREANERAIGLARASPAAPV